MTTINAVIVSPDGTAQKVEVERHYRAFQAIVGGYIEGIFPGGFTVYVNEEGIMQGLSLNRRIQEVLGGTPPSILGNALIVGPGDEEGNDTDVPDFIVRHYELENR